MKGAIVALLGLFEIGLTSFAHGFLSNLPPELDILGEPEQILNAQFPLDLQPFTFDVWPGVYIPENVTQNAPEINVCEISSPCEMQTKFVIIMGDPDLNTTDPTFIGLHMMVADVTSSSKDSTIIASYIGPEPPVGEAHNYTLLAFYQPESFSVPPQYLSYVATTASSPLNRINFPLVDFIAETDLGRPVAANWFRGFATDSSAR